MARAPKKQPPDPSRMGRTARAELESFGFAFERVREDLLERIAATAPAQQEERETAYMAIWLLGRVRDAVVSAANQAPMDEYEKTLAQVMNGTGSAPN